VNQVLNREERLRSRRAAVVLLAAALVIDVLAVAARNEAETPSVTKTSMFTTTLSTVITVTSTLNHTTTISVYGGTKLVGNCTAVSYFRPDSTIDVFSNVTITSGASTSYSLSSVSWAFAPSTVVGSSTYTTAIYANDTATFTFVSTSTGDYSPSAGWTVTACSFNG